MSAPRVGLGSTDDPVANVRHCFDHGGVTELAPKSADRDEHGIGEWISVFIPDLFEQVLRAQYGVFGAHQCFEDPELLHR